MTREPIPDCPQPETPIRERAWTDAQKAAHFTAEEVRDYADACRLLHKGPVIADMLTAYADTLSKPADSGRVGDAMVDRAMTAWNESSFTGGAGLRGRWRESIEAALAAPKGDGGAE